MKRIFFWGVLATLFIMSCKKDEFTEQDARQSQIDLIYLQDSLEHQAYLDSIALLEYQDSLAAAQQAYQDSIDHVRDSLNKLAGIFEFSVSVIPVNGGTAFLKSGNSMDALEGAVVTISQHGVTQNVTTDQSGIAVFTDLRLGEVNVNVSVESYSSVSFIAQIKAETDEDNLLYYDVERHAAVMIPVFSLEEGTSTISGKITYETDLLNDMPESAANVNVVGVIDTDDSDFEDTYFGDNLTSYSSCDQCEIAEIIQVAYTDMTASALTDAEGNYTLEMPSSANGLPVKITVSDVAADQTLILDKYRSSDDWAVYSGIRTLFSTEFDFAAHIGDDNVKLPDEATIPVALVTFSAPDGTVAQQPVEEASAKAVVGESGISAIIISDQGRGYTQPPVVHIFVYNDVNGNGVYDGADTEDTDAWGQGAEAVAYIAEGKVTQIEITNPGSGYHYSDDIAVVLEDKLGEDAAADAHVTYSVTAFNVENKGWGYQSIPEVTVISNSGSGAQGAAVIGGYVNAVTVESMGSGYVCEPVIMFDAPSYEFDNATMPTAAVEMTTYNPIHSIELNADWINETGGDGLYVHLYETAPDVMIDAEDAGEEGSGATAIAVLDDGGVINDINLSNAGLGYTEAPAVVVIGDGEGAALYATLNDGDGSINIEIADGGYGYSNATIEITAAPNGGVNAVAAPVLAYKIDRIQITNPGSAYNIEPNGDGTYANQPTVSINDVDLTPNTDVYVRPSMKVKEITIDDYMVDGGYGYTSVPNITIEPACGFGSGAVATAEVRYRVERIDVANGGSGYYCDADFEVVVVTPVEGCDEQATVYDDDDVNNAFDGVNLGNGMLEVVNLTAGGDNYLAPPIVTLEYDGNPTNTEITATVSGGSVTGFVIADAGGDLELDCSDFEIVIETKDAAAECNANAYTESGKISFVEITNAGAGYTVEPSVRFIRQRWEDANNDDIFDESELVDYTSPNMSSTFIDAEADIVMEDGRITEINITNAGTGYYYEPRIEIFVPDYVQTAIGEVVAADQGNGMYYISGIDLIANGDGETGGAGYATPPTITITPLIAGQGSGATAHAVISNGKVVEVVMDSYGSGYWAKNIPTTAQGISYMPADDLETFTVVGGQSYIRDIYLGTGMRTLE